MNWNNLGEKKKNLLLKFARCLAWGIRNGIQFFLFKESCLNLAQAISDSVILICGLLAGLRGNVLRLTSTTKWVRVHIG